MNLRSLMGPGAWEHYRAPSVREVAETVRQAMTDWDNATPDQRADALRKAGEAAGRDEICVMDWNRCTEKSCDLYASGCPHFTEESEYTRVCPVCAKPLQNERIDEHGEESGAHGEEHMADCPVCVRTWHWDDEGFWGEVI